jgi:cellulose synthase/poly-beta-1,6-N-acetylglucosamine synthase-like glycosyltransferase
MTGVNAIVVVPARDEARRIGACLEALTVQTVERDAFAVIVVLDDCSDDTRAVVADATRRCRLGGTVVPGPGADRVRPARSEWTWRATGCSRPIVATD